MPRVSVLMTSYNRAAYIGSAIESVLAQTFTDFELIIVDDGSSDASASIAQSYASRDPRVRVHVNARNLGQFQNRNFAASLATGDFIRYADSDDIQYPHCLDILVGMMDAFPDAMFAIGGSRAWRGAPVPLLSTPVQSFQREFIGDGMFHLGPGAGLFRREPFLEAGGFTINSETGTASDYLLWLRLCARYNALLVPADLFWYREHPSQELRSATHELGVARLGAFKWAALHDAPLDERDRGIARRNMAGRAARQIVRDLTAFRFHLAWVRLTQSGLSIGDWLRYARRPVHRPTAGVGA